MSYDEYQPPISTALNEIFWDFDPVGVPSTQTGGEPMCLHEPYITYVDRLRLAELIGQERKRHPPLDELERALLRVAPFDPAEIPADVVTMNSVVRLGHPRSADPRTLTLVYPGNGPSPPALVLGASPVSILSPLGAALLGRRTGDLIDWSDDGQGRTARIQSVPYQPEAHGNSG